MNVGKQGDGSRAHPLWITPAIGENVSALPTPEMVHEAWQALGPLIGRLDEDPRRWGKIRVGLMTEINSENIAPRR
jgi:hypothetical protein